MNNATISESYHGFNIEGKRENPTMGDYSRWYFHVYLEGKYKFLYSIRINSPYGEKSKIDQMLSTKGFNRVCGMIDLGKYQEGESKQDIIAIEDQNNKNTLTDKKMRLEILNVLHRIKRMLGKQAMFESFNVEGFCDILGIDKSNYLHNAIYLQEKKYVADSLVQQKPIEDGGIYITADGIDYLEADGNLNLGGNTTYISTGGGKFVGRDDRAK